VITQGDQDSPVNLIKKAIQEVEGVFTPSTFLNLNQLCKSLSTAKNIICYGVGREGLMMKSLTMRLTHLGLNAYFVGDMNVPPATKEDLLLVSAGPGFFSTVDALVGVATKADCKTIVFTARPDRLNEHTYHQVVHIPAQTMADDLKNPKGVLPMGSLYEAALFLFFEIVIITLRELLQESAESMRARHTNLE
jgi:6-phospho-3-hexuloisomerase